MRAAGLLIFYFAFVYIIRVFALFVRDIVTRWFMFSIAFGSDRLLVKIVASYQPCFIFTLYTPISSSLTPIVPFNEIESHQTAHAAEQAEEHAAAVAAEYARGVSDGNAAGTEATAAAAKEQVGGGRFFV